MSTPELVIRRAALGGDPSDLVDVTVRRPFEGSRVTEVRPARPRAVSVRAAEIIDAQGGALIPGLHDHHLHLLATAAWQTSVDLDPAVVSGRSEMADRLTAACARAPAHRWVRAVGYHESVAGELDRDLLDAVAGEGLVRVQHRSGAVWAVGSAGLAALGIAEQLAPGARDAVAGIERDAAGRPTGRIFRADDQLHELWPTEVSPDLTKVGLDLLRAGVTGCTDATPHATDEAAASFASIVERDIPQHVVAMSGPGVGVPRGRRIEPGPVKVVLGDHELPALDDIESWFTDAHRVGRPVAVHIVTAAALALAIAAWQATGVRPGDRIEHAAVVPDAAVGELSRLGVRVVTQPCFVAERGDSYLRDIPPAEHHELWRCASLLAAGVPVAGSSDAPYGSIDPWAAIVTARDRRTRSGQVLGPQEQVSARQALDLYLAPLGDPGGPPRRVVVGAPGDLCVLDRALPEMLCLPLETQVVATVIDGRVWHHGVVGT